MSGENFPSSSKASQGNSLDQVTSSKVKHWMTLNAPYLHEHTSCNGQSLIKKSRTGVSPTMSSYTGNDQSVSSVGLPQYQAPSATKTWSCCGNGQLVCSSRSQVQQSLGKIGNCTASSETAITQTTPSTIYTTSNNQSIQRVNNQSTQRVNDQSTHRVIEQSTHSSIGNKQPVLSPTTFDIPCFTDYIRLNSTSSSNSRNTFGVLSASPVRNLQTNQPSKPDEPTNSKNDPSKMFSRNDHSCFTRPTCQFNSTPNTTTPHFQRPVPNQPITLPSRPREPNREYSPFGPSEFQLTVSLSQDPWDVSTQNAEWMYRDKTGLELALNPNTSLLLEHLYTPGSQLNTKVRMILPEIGREYEISLKEMEMTDVGTGERIALFRKTWIPDVQPHQTDLSEFPSLWSAQNYDIVLVTLDRRTTEYQAVQDAFLRTMQGSCISAIMRVQNKKLFIRYAFQKALLLDKNSGNEQSLNEKLLFHGTSQTPPSKIWQSEDGFDLRYCRRGMWGIGSYFAENAFYSNQYAYSLGMYSELREMIVASVLTGNSIQMPSGGNSTQLIRPPVYFPATKDSPEVLYDSVTGFTGGSRIYVVYKFDMAYPSYLVRYFPLT